jgi:hypothetical protein
MEYSFPRYLMSKQSVDERALNRQVYERLAASLPGGKLRIIEVGAGIGTMLARLLRWGLFTQAEYVLVDEMQENIMHAEGWLRDWAAENGMHTSIPMPGTLHMADATRELTITLVQADVFDYIKTNPEPADLLIAHAFLDLLPMPASLTGLFSLLRLGGLAWLTINFDGVTTLEPVIEPALDLKIEQLYHRSMDTRPSGGDSQAGRHLFTHLARFGVQIMAAGSSDWVVHAIDGHYPVDEAYFLHFILHFFELSLSDQAELDRQTLLDWLDKRRAQVERGELVYIAHQMDFLVKLPRD